MMRNKRRSRTSLQALHADDWLMTYADMITLLLCFFAVFLSVSVPKKDATAKLEAPHKQSSFGTPDLMEENLLPNNTGTRIVIPTTEMVGDRITTMQVSSSTFFENSSATLTPEGQTMLAQEAEILKSPRYSSYEITVEGHTDDTPISTEKFSSNWELSTARAAAVVHFFIDHGLDPRKLRSAGYADTFPRAPNRDAAGNPIPENQAKNRRVVIKLQKLERVE